MLQVKEEAKRQVSVARLFPEKNRSIDCVPYDHARVQLSTATDNYINAVYVKVSSFVSFEERKKRTSLCGNRT